MIRSLTALALGASTVLLASSALAQDANAPAPAASASASTSATATTDTADHPISAALLVGFGLNNENGGSGDTVNAYGLGFGVRAGYTLPMKVYVGGTFIYHLGYSKDVGGGSVTARVNPLGVEGGYDISAGPVVIRPFLGLGLALYSSTVTVLGQSIDAGGSKLALWPGVLVMYPVTDQFFVGADVRYTIVTGVDSAGGGSPNALGIYANVGYKF